MQTIFTIAVTLLMRPKSVHHWMDFLGMRVTNGYVLPNQSHGTLPKAMEIAF